jgi:KDO2-lipid IV(A) lauroyltransferase
VPDTPKKKRKKRRLSSRLLAWAPARILGECWLFCAIFFVTVFGHRWAYFWVRVYASLVWVLARRLRGTALRNVDLCLPELPLAERTRIARASFRHFGYLFIDYFLAPRYFKGERGLAFIEGSTRESPYIQWVAEGKAAFILAAHFGNWEVGTWNVNRFGYAPLMVIAKPFQPPALDRRIVRAREVFGDEVHQHKGGARVYARALKENRTVGILVDQNGGDFAPVETFFGVPCTWQADFARLAVRGGGRVAFAAMRREGDQFRFKYLESRVMRYQRETDPMQIVRDYRDFLEATIRQNPEQYFWMHRRFKARKEGWPDAYADLGTRLTAEERARIIEGRVKSASGR